MIKKFNILLVYLLLFSSKSYGFSNEIEQQIYIGCYGNSKQYIGADKAKNYCLCTLEKLSEKYNDDEINEIFKKKPEDIIDATKFASIYCEQKISE
tara:strand:+ start:105 stop:392 length:288 start_codon:yes stop_codon:yes gene_type:complete